MYKNVGKKIMFLAKILGWVALATGIIVWMCFITSDYRYDTSIAWIGLISGGLSFISSWLVYGFGQIVDDVNTMRNNLPINTEVSTDELPEL